MCIDKQGFDFPSHNLGKGCVLILQNQSIRLHVMSEQHICRAQISGTTESCEVCTHFGTFYALTFLA